MNLAFLAALRENENESDKVELTFFEISNRMLIRLLRLISADQNIKILMCTDLILINNSKFDSPIALINFCLR